MSGEYISREAALTVMERLRDKCGNDEMAFALNWASGLLRNVPAADVVEVVRCRECIYWLGENDLCKGICIDFDADGYCSEGKRKDGGQDDV